MATGLLCDDMRLRPIRIKYPGGDPTLLAGYRFLKTQPYRSRQDGGIFAEILRLPVRCLLNPDTLSGLLSGFGFPSVRRPEIATPCRDSCRDSRHRFQGQPLPRRQPRPRARRRPARPARAHDDDAVVAGGEPLGMNKPQLARISPNKPPLRANWSRIGVHHDKIRRAPTIRSEPVKS
jgi:hypothetical protein